jgi:hypothetical protein
LIDRDETTQGMTWLTRVLVEPFYRVVYGPPLEPPGLRASPARESESRREGLVLVAGGVGGVDLCATGLRYVLGAERLPYALQVVPWGHGLGRWHADLTDVAHRDAQARALAEMIRAHNTERPSIPIFLVAKSGGSGIAVKALEFLEHPQVERAVLLAPALAPDYDLTRALGAVRHDIVVFWSPLDVVILGAGTRIFGTIDRKRARSAGMVGFQLPSAERRDEAGRKPYDKLHQIRWRPGMAAAANFGGHWGPDSPVFLRKYVAPLLRIEEGADS